MRLERRPVLVPKAVPPGRRIAVLACVGLSLSLVSPADGALRRPVAAAAATPAAATPALTASSAPNAAHPYSDPIWSPLRTPAWTSCVLTNCPGSYHGVWAIDFLSKTRENKKDPLYAAGAGIFHVGAVMGKDTCSNTTASSGTWVWIDHGGGRTTRYTHLYEVSAREGQLVTPATRIGYMGHNGNRSPCKVNYLHMEYRAGGNSGTRVAPSAMLACVGKGRVSMPSQGLGRSYASWNSLPIGAGLRGPSTPAATNNCLSTSSGANTPNRPAATGSRGPSSATIRWGAVPAGVNHSIVTIEKWFPSLGRYSSPTYRTVAGRASATKFTGLLNGRPYRFRVATHNGSGYSAWSSYRKVVPAAAPSAPRSPRKLSTTVNTIRYAWWLPPANGAPISRHVVARRCLVKGAWTKWAKTNIAAPRAGRSWTLNYNWRGMPRGRSCQVMVQAVNSVGNGHWSKVSRATTRR